MGSVVYSKWKGINYARTYSKPTGEPTEKQQNIRNAFGKLVQDWKQLNGVMHLGWETYAENRNLTGFNAFIGANSANQKKGLPLRLFREMGEESLMNFTVVPGAAAGEISVSFLRTEEIAGRHVTFFTQKKVNGLAQGKFRRYDGGVDTAPPFTISGLEAGQEYFVYGVVTDSAFGTAAKASESDSAVCAAGA
ncbi:MAG: hypothetical protein EPN93_11890 [Spirochaetes bacterium]|nr:MAG: hypothetical protein EPN93_11890 [Spirochaetota bacterium]